MSRVWPKLLVVLLVAVAQSLAQTQDSSSKPPVPGSGPPSKNTISIQPAPAEPPLPPDARPPSAAPATPPDKSKSRLKRALSRAAPQCLDAIFHTCWSHPSEEKPPGTPADREFAKDMEVGDFYFQQKNYKAAEMRFRDALTYKSDEPVATFKLAQSLDKLGKSDQAAQAYQAYLKAEPAGRFSQQAEESLQRLAKKSAAK